MVVHPVVVSAAGLAHQQALVLEAVASSQASVTSRWSSVREVKKVMMWPSSYHLFNVSKASGNGSHVAMRSGSSLGTSSVMVPSMSIK